MDLRLKNKVVLISGGAKGIGAACAKLFLNEGASVVIADLDAEAGERLLESLGGERLICLSGDLSDAATCENVIKETVAKFGKLDVLINNAGVNDSVGLGASPEEFSRSLQRNLVPAFSLAHFAVNELKKNQGSIVNLGSKVAVTGQGATSGYAAAKGGINALTREWAAALASANVRVNAVLPAECDTDQYQKWFASVEDPKATRAAVENLIPLGRRMTTPEEMAAMVVFLASPISSHTTGQIVFVDGGYSHLDRALTASHAKWH